MAAQITVCICTYRRPELLASLLSALAQQQTDGQFVFDVVVADNDARRSAEAVVTSAASDSPFALYYDCEPERNISMTRNRAIRNATGDLIAFIDDDELPPANWLLDLYRTFGAFPCDGVLAPVLPDFPSDAPAWLGKAGVFKRRRLKTGERIGEGDARTGNVLLRRALFVADGCWFNPAFGRSGGEDTDFFHRQFERGGVFVWCDEAAVTEAVPPERWAASFHVKRLLRAGTTDGELMRSGMLPSQGLILRNAVILCACLTAALPAMLLLPKHLWMRIAQKLAYCSGLVSAYFGWSLLRYRD
jgi:glycosyltransferase involved in cell wall biosynthesis